MKAGCCVLLALPQLTFIVNNLEVIVFMVQLGAVALANIFCWAAALLYAQMGAKSVVICPIPYKHSSFPDIPFGMPDFKLFCFQPLKSMLSLMKKDDSPFFRSESCNEAY